MVKQILRDIQYMERMFQQQQDLYELLYLVHRLEGDIIERISKYRNNKNAAPLALPATAYEPVKETPAAEKTPQPQSVPPTYEDIVVFTPPPADTTTHTALKTKDALHFPDNIHPAPPRHPYEYIDEVRLKDKKDPITPTLSPSVNDNFSTQTDKKDINDQLKSDNPALGDWITQNTVIDVRNRINLNDRILFIRELFNNDMNAFESVIQALNHLQKPEEIDAYLSEQVVIPFGWHQKTDIANYFIQLVKKQPSSM